MAKIVTLSQLQSALDKDFSWRIMEISHLKRAIPSSEGSRQTAILRANLALIYAHWEGFVKTSATHYLEYVRSKKLRSRDLQNCFVYLGMKRAINDLNQVKRANVGVDLLNTVLGKIDDEADFSHVGAINTESNLKSDVLEGILATIGLDSSAYRPYYNLIDESLLAKRNKIAHGEYIDLDVVGFEETSEKVLMLMRWFKTGIENSASTESYRIPSIVN